MNRKLSLLLILVLLVGLLVPAVTGAEGITDASVPAAPHFSHRLIVELSSPPLAQAPVAARLAASGGKLDVSAPEAQQYIQKLQAEQQAFVAAMTHAVPNAKVATYINEQGRELPATYQVVFNGMSVDAGRNADLKSLELTLAKLPGVKRVYRDYAHSPDLYASLPLINAQAAWNNAAIGGKSNAGAGVKFASMDGGVHHLSPMFDGAGYTYPAGFPKGLTSNTNGKIIASRVYFRAWDPPSAGDENPWPGVAGTQHGTHTASTVAGGEVQASFQGSAPVTISGVAPKAYVMSYRVFYNSITNDGSFYNTEGIKALEDIVADGADVLNNSWGGGPGSIGGEYDALDQALINAVKAGIFVSMSNGNAGPNKGTGDHPSADYINVAASSTSGTWAAGLLKVTAPAPVPADLQKMGFGVAQFGPALPIASVLGPFSFVPAAVVDPTNTDGCKAFPDGAFAGKTAVIIRGTCNFSVKVLNAQKAGAAFAVIYNQASNGDTLITMAAGTGAAEVTISSVIVGNTNGKNLLAWYTANGAASQLALDTTGYQAGNTPDIIASFSSRGPGVGDVLKPDIAAPGVNILAQGFDATVTGEAGNFGYGQASGTSMAAPHVTGAAALIKQIHPDWSPAWIKSALMSTSKYMDIYTDAAKTIPAQPLDMGAGRLDLTNAANPGVILDPPSLSFGSVPMGATKSLDVMITSVADTAETYAVSTLFTGKGYNALTAVDGLTVSPTSITLAPGATAKLTVTWDSSLTSGEGDRQGFVILDGASHDAHMPAWMRVTYKDMAAAEVLIIDNDGSSSLGLPDYTPYYTAALDKLGVTYDVLDTDNDAGAAANFLPEAVKLAQYKAIIYQTGDNFSWNGRFTVPTPLTTRDMNRLVEYANQGGAILAFGQDLASVTGGNTTSAPFFYAAVLGATYLQDSINAEQVYTDTTQLMTGLPGTPFGNTSFDISGMGDGAANQGYVDEIATNCTDPDFTFCTVTPLLKYSIGGNNVKDGYVALANRDFVTLERPAVTYLGKSVYASFGLEGVNDDTGFNTREDLLGAALDWVWDAATVSIAATPKPNGQVTYFTATVDSTHGGAGVTYRWDFGDGTPFTNVYKSATVGHTYADPGTYTVRVEATDGLGTHTIGQTTVTVLPEFNTPASANFPVKADAYLHSGEPASNYGTAPYLHTHLTASGHDSLRSVLAFDVSSIASKYPVKQATLSVYLDSFSGGAVDGQLQVFEVTTPWSEKTVTWNTPWVKPGGDFSDTVMGSASINKTMAGTWIKIDVTPLVAKWVADPMSNHGLMLRLRKASSVSGYRFVSANNWVKANAPKLDVSYMK